MATIIYLHGFASAGNGPKALALRERFKNHTVISPDLPTDPTEVEFLVNNIVKSVTSFPIVFVGTSLGGFWANYFAQKWDTKCVLVNPSTTPSRTMLHRIGKVVKNYATGKDIEVREEYVARFLAREEYVATDSNGANVYLFVAKDDDVIPYRETLANIKYSAVCVVSEDGGHRYDTKFDAVLDTVANIVNV